MVELVSLLVSLSDELAACESEASSELAVEEPASVEVLAVDEPSESLVSAPSELLALEELTVSGLELVSELVASVLVCSEVL